MQYKPKSELKLSDSYNGAKVEAVGTMVALVYYGQNNMRVVPDRPIFCTENDILLEINCIHRCGTDVKILKNGRPDPIDDRLLQELQVITGVIGSYDKTRIGDYFELIETGKIGDNADEFYQNLVKKLGSIDREKLYQTILREWGRVLGHEICGIIVYVGSNVRSLTEPLGYTEPLGELPAEYLSFQPGERVTVQSRIARYEQPNAEAFKALGITLDNSVRGVQLLGNDHENMAMLLDGGYSQLLRITPEIIRSGSILRVPSGVLDIEAALVEPAACLVDSISKATHSLGQGSQGDITKPGLKYGGHTAIIGSGSMAFMAAEIALLFDPQFPIGGASKVTMFVRSEEKERLCRRLLGEYSARLDILVDKQGTSHDGIVRHVIATYGNQFGFDDVIVAAGSDAKPIELAHKLPLNTDFRVICFAGTSGIAEIESGVWHYGNAGTSGTSGCNTRAMENVLGMIQRKSLKLEKYSGEQYTFDDLETNVRKFFNDKHLRPRFIPNEGTEPVVLETADGESLIQGTSK